MLGYSNHLGGSDLNDLKVALGFAVEGIPAHVRVPP